MYDGSFGKDAKETARILEIRMRGYLEQIPETSLMDPTIPGYKVIVDEEAAMAPFLAEAYRPDGDGSSVTHALGQTEDDDARYFAELARNGGEHN